ncbi:caspase family protein [Pectobacterium sp. CHL-2024]|uniref:caspase family protein n=1 Tax=Pectobacterium sp. CHL-2024 TaxID=3377079 RepID=UPI0037F88E7B
MRKALIIGNENYYPTQQKLSNPINDAALISEVLGYKGFQVTIHYDLNNSGMNYYFQSFCDTINEGDDVVFYFAGHGIEYRDVNYLLSVDFHQLDVNTSISLDNIQKFLFGKNKTGLKLIIIDACRNNPGLLEAPPAQNIKTNNNVLIAYSTSSGNTAKDGRNGNSLYTKLLAENIKNYNQTLSTIFSKTREEIILKTNFSQIPWEYSSLLESKSFSFDNIKAPLKLTRIIKNSFSQAYAMKCFEDVIIVAGDSKYLNFFITSSSTVKSKTFDFGRDFKVIESIDFNDKYFILVTDIDTFYLFDINGVKIKEIQLDHSLFTTLINEYNVAFFAGMSHLIYIFDTNSGDMSAIDIRSEILRKIYDRDDMVNFTCSRLTIMSMSCQIVNPNILAFGGNNSVFCVKNLENDAYLFINTDREIFSDTYSICFSNDGRYMATGHENGKCILWNAENYQILNIFKTNENIVKNQFFEFTDEMHSNYIPCVRFTPDSKVLAISTSESSVIFYDTYYFKTIDSINLNIEPFPIYGMEFNKGGDSLVVSMKEKSYIFCRS